MGTGVSSTQARRPDEAADPRAARVWDIAATVCDPEVPVLTLADLGVLRSARVNDDGTAVVEITPTYSGCPAMGTMRDDISEALAAQGFPRHRVVLVLSPAWTTDWMTEDGKAKLERFGIAPPTGAAAARDRSRGPVALALSVRCPQCGSLDTHELSRFGSTSCKALWTCRACLEPFDYFKVH